ncbi:MAG: septum site-determining protein MinC [Desulfobacteraceae bacterium 4572_130]|nr:MAG: septum site-determining protein MinC [Desulfobacteraceae bacterium 4572_130]
MNFENNLSVKLKGVGDGFWVTLNPLAKEAKLKKDISQLFERLKHLAINAKVVIDIGDGVGYDELISNIGLFLKEKFDVGFVSQSPRKKSKPLKRIRQRDLSKEWAHHRSDVLMIRGRVRSGQKITTKKHIVIIGDINPGAEIYVGGDIIVMGKLMGQVYAGYPNNDKAIIIAIDFKPTQVQIGSFIARELNKNSSEIRAKFACVKKSIVVIQDYLKANPFKDIPWPEVI